MEKEGIKVNTKKKKEKGGAAGRGKEHKPQG